jgi:hypothetical protein
MNKDLYIKLLEKKIEEAETPLALLHAILGDIQNGCYTDDPILKKLLNDAFEVIGIEEWEDKNIDEKECSCNAIDMMDIRMCAWGKCGGTMR